MRARARPRDASTRAMVTGRVNRRGPALPGFRNVTPSRVSTFGWCEWPAITIATPDSAGSIASFFTS